MLPSLRTFMNINEELQQLYQENNFGFIDSFQITTNDLWKDGIYLVEDGKVLLPSNFINKLNYFSRKTQNLGMQVFCEVHWKTKFKVFKAVREL